MLYTYQNIMPCSDFNIGKNIGGVGSRGEKILYGGTKYIAGRPSPRALRGPLLCEPLP